MADSIFKKMGSVIATTLENTKAEMSEMVENRLDTELLNINNNLNLIENKLNTEILNINNNVRIVENRLNTEIINTNITTNNNIETIISTMRKENLHRILNTRII